VPGNTIGGSEPGAGNVISGNNDTGVVIQCFGGNSNIVQGNLIGTDVTGTRVLGNGGSGVSVGGNDNTIGGTSPGARNVISANGAGIAINGARRSVVQGNLIGTAMDGISDLGNRLFGIGIAFGASDNSIGGISNGAGNIIAFNGGEGVLSHVGQNPCCAAAGINNAILSNSIFSNDSLGIDLAPGLLPLIKGVTPNDSGDGDTGPNNLQNFPVLTSAIGAPGSTTIEGTLNSTSNTQFRIELFVNSACDSRGHGEGETFIGSPMVTTDGSGDAFFSFVHPNTVPSGSFITATATDPNGNTSEFSRCVQVVAILDLSIAKTSSPDPVVPGSNLTYTLAAINPATGSGTATGVVVTDVLPVPSSFLAALDGSQEVPPVTIPATGSGTFTLNASHTELAFQITVDVAQLSGPISAAHIHNAPPGVDGAIFRNLEFVGETASGIWKNTDLQSLTPVLVHELLAGNLYVNVHTTLNPGGEIRGQIIPTPAAGVVSFVSATPTQGTCGELGGMVTCNLGDMPAGTTATVDIVVTVDPATPDGTILTNKASVSANEADANPADNTATVTTTVQATRTATEGKFADQVILLNDPDNSPDEGPPSSMLGPPDGIYVDMDGGGTTFGFSNLPVVFDWGVGIPDRAQLVIVTLEGFDNVFGEVTWGYGVPIDNGDGVASNPTGATQLLGTTTISPNPWGGGFHARLLFYSFDGDFDGVGEDFFLSLDDLADTEIDAAFVLSAQNQAEPSFELHQDSLDGATGLKVDITQVTSSVTGNRVAVPLGAFQAQLTYDGSCLNILDIREMDFTIAAKNITNGATGSATFNGFSTFGVAPAADLGHALTRLTGSASVPCPLNLEITDLTDLDGNSIQVEPPSLSRELLRGDARADGVINIADALFVAQYLVGLRDACTAVVDTTCLQSVNAASVRHDGGFDRKTIADALLIAQHLVGLRDEFFNLLGG